MKKIFYCFVLFFLNHSVMAAATHTPEKFLHDIQGKADEGEQIVKQYCSSCHAPKPIIPIGAPCMGDKKAWAPRIKQGMDLLFKHANEGLNAMPARGGCFECTDEQLMRAIEFLLQKNTKKNQ